jgi:drug/metabolite transporter (DMT)-like permease
MVVIPMDFLRLPLAGIMGWLLYQESMDVFVILGALIMFGGNLIGIYTEKRRLNANNG